MTADELGPFTIRYFGVRVPLQTELWVRCQRCGASRHEPCHTPAGRKIGYSHRTRERLAEITAAVGIVALITAVAERRASSEALNRSFANACNAALGRSPIDPSTLRDVITR